MADDAPPPPPMIDAMMDAALQAAHIALKRRQEGFVTHTKPDGSFVTNGDVQSEQVIRAALEKATPALLQEPVLRGYGDIGYVMEETEHDFAHRGQGLKFVVDPIDGTLGYSRKQPGAPWAISIGLEREGKTIASVVYEAADNEYGVALDGTDLPYDPLHPKGKLFWATADGKAAYRIDPPPEGFSVTAPAMSAYREVTNQDGLQVLETVPDVKVDYRRGTTTVLDAATPGAPEAGFQVDSFLPDRAAHLPLDKSPVRAQILDTCREAGLTPQNCYSTVAGGVRAADGRSAGLINGGGFPWDQSAIRLIMEKAGLRVAEYEAAGAEGSQSLLMAARDEGTLLRLKDKIMALGLTGISPAPAPQQGALPAGKPMTPARPTLWQRLFRRFGLGAAALPAVAAAPRPAPPVIVAANAAPESAPAVTHVPRTLEQLTRLSDEEKILLAAATASGCDAVGYYTPAPAGGFELARHVDLYPTRETRFAATMDGFRADTFASDEAVRANAAYQIPVYVPGTHSLKGVIVLHAPTESYSRVQTDAEQASADQLHEPAPTRRAKLIMASHIVARHQDLFGLSGAVLRQREAVHKAVPEKLDYFMQLTKDMFATFVSASGEMLHPDDFESVQKARSVGELKAALRKIAPWYSSAQASHVIGVTDFMKHAMDAVNTGQEPPPIDAQQSDLLEILTLLHDVGKTQMSSNFLRQWRHESTAPDELKRQETYNMVANHNHPLFTLLTQLFYRDDAVVSAAHHHGLFRYSDEELHRALGDDFRHYSILTDNIPPQALSPLSKLMRVADVSEAASSGGYGDKPISLVLRELAAQAGYKDGEVRPAPVTPNSIDPDYLCFLIDNGAFDAFGRQRNAEEPGCWKSKSGQPKYDPAETKAVGDEILAAFGWAERKQAVEQSLRDAVRNDALIRGNAADARAASQRRA